LDVTFATGGTYYLLVNDLLGDETGDFVVRLQVINPPSAVASLTYDETVLATISALTEQVAYSFDAGAGDKIRVRMQPVSGGIINPFIEVFDPQGTRLGSGVSGSVELTLTNSGTYYAVFSEALGSGTGTFHARIEQLNAPPSAIALAYDQTVSGTITDPLELVAYRFDGTAGSRIRLQMQRVGTLDPNIELFDANGVRRASATVIGPLPQHWTRLWQQRRPTSRYSATSAAPGRVTSMSACSNSAPRPVRSLSCPGKR